MEGNGRGLFRKLSEGNRLFSLDLKLDTPAYKLRLLTVRPVCSLIVDADGLYRRYRFSLKAFKIMVRLSTLIDGRI
jgi:hypothetical protein